MSFDTDGKITKEIRVEPAMNGFVVDVTFEEPKFTDYGKDSAPEAEQVRFVYTTVRQVMHDVKKLLNPKKGATNASQEANNYRPKGDCRNSSRN